MGLKELFNPSRAEIWKRLAKEMDVEYLKKGILSLSIVRAQYGEWIISLDTFTHKKKTYTRIYSRHR